MGQPIKNCSEYGSIEIQNFDAAATSNLNASVRSRICENKWLQKTRIPNSPWQKQ
jgi:hypothetical protein